MYRALLAQLVTVPATSDTSRSQLVLVMPTSARIMLVVSASLLAGVNAMHQNRARSHTSHTDAHTALRTQLFAHACCGALTFDAPIFHACRAELSHGMRTVSLFPLLSLRSWVQATLPHFG